MGLDLSYSAGQTPLNEEEVDGLKITHISTQNELNEFEQLNIETALEWLIRSKPKSERVLTQKSIKQVHKKMFDQVWKWAGEFRKTDKNIGVPWHQIGFELKYLLDDTQYWIRNETYPPEEIALRFKHRLVAIHCFPNGNGRHSRLIADTIMSTIFKLEPFVWGGHQSLDKKQIRQHYIKALQLADQGEMKALLSFARSE